MFYVDLCPCVDIGMAERGAILYDFKMVGSLCFSLVRASASDALGKRFEPSISKDTMYFHQKKILLPYPDPMGS